MFSLFGHVFGGLSPLAALGVAAFGTAAVVALYLLRERERRVRVAFVALWQPEAGSRRIERLGRRLRRWLSLALQLALLWLLILALIDPRPASTAPAARSWVILVDRSASMAARLGESSRMAEARRQVHRIIETLGPEDRAMVASFAREVTAETGFEIDGRTLAAATDRVGVAEESADLPRALAFAAAVLRGRPRPMVVIVGDGRYQAHPLPGLEIRWVPVGAPGGNVALSSLSGRRRALDPGTVDLTLVVENFSAAAATTTVEILAGERSLERLPITLQPRERATRTVAAVAREGQLTARLVGVAPANLLTGDDRAVTTVAEQRRRRVLVVGEQNLYLDGALLSFGTGLLVQRAAAADPRRFAGYDAVIFDGLAPGPVPTAGRFLYLDPHGAGSPWPERGPIEEPVLSDADRHHPLLAQLSLADLNIREARRLMLSGDDRAVASSFGTPLLVARSRPGWKAVALTFDVRRSDLPLRPSFPLLLANIFDWLDDASAKIGPRTGITRVDATESDTSQAPALKLGRTFEPWTVPPPSRGRPWGALALLAAFALSLFEWATHHRRWTV